MVWTQMLCCVSPEKIFVSFKNPDISRLFLTVYMISYCFNLMVQMSPTLDNLVAVLLRVEAFKVAILCTHIYMGVKSH